MSNTTPEKAAITKVPAIHNLEYTDTGLAIVGIFPGRTAESRPYAAICRMTSKGLIVSQMNHVPLSERAGEWITIKGKSTPTIDGYNKINLFAGISFIVPETIRNDAGREVSNPAFDIDDRGTLRSVKIRMIGVGRKPTGNWGAIDYTLRFDLGSYFVRDLYSKWGGKKAASPKEWGDLYNADNIPPEIKQDPRKRVYFLPGDVALAVDLTHADVRELLQERNERAQMAERLARSFCQRNIIRHFTGIHLLEIPGDGPVIARVVSWTQPDRDVAEMMDVAKSVRSGKFTIDGQVVDVERADGNVTDEDDDDMDNQSDDRPTFDPDQVKKDVEEADKQADEGEMPPLADVAAAADEEEKLLATRRAELSKLVKSFGQNRLEIDPILERYGINARTWADYASVSGLDAAIAEISEISVVKPGAGRASKTATTHTKGNPKR